MDVYLPTGDEALARIDRGSGIVGSDWSLDDHLLVDFEGGRYHSSNIKTYADRVYHAAGRHAERYPTVARMAVAKSELLHIGTFANGEVRVRVQHIDQLCDWLGCSIADLRRELALTDAHRGAWLGRYA